LPAVNAAIAAIRATGATQKISVPGSFGSSAMEWNGLQNFVSPSNATVMVPSAIIDPLNNWIYEVHQYLDSDASGTAPDVVSPTIGVERLTDVTNWALANNAQLLLGEMGTAIDSASQTALNNTLAYMQANNAVWKYFTWWSAGPLWGDYIFLLEPDFGPFNAGPLVEKPQMSVLQLYVTTGKPTLRVKHNATAPPLSTSSKVFT